MTYPWVQIVWWDAADYPGTWVDLEEAKAFATRPCEIVSYGYLLAENKHYVVIAADRILQDEGDSVTFGRVTKIPKPWIRSMRAIKPRKKAR